MNITKLPNDEMLRRFCMPTNHKNMKTDFPVGNHCKDGEKINQRIDSNGKASKNDK